MAKVSLRAYNREIETMIDRGQLDEAIANCHHIFKTYPKHLETYRLLGKAYLEYKRFKEAVDVFSRVLVSEPNDFVANVGMSIIRDDENKLDDAIWHMERAFETQPSNAAIQSELQRLYGRRDGVQPPRIRMTRGALAHMYVQGELYPQAISEIKSVLKEDPGRSDMEALLARACYRSGLKNEAADAASKVLRRYPYCLDANRVLMEIFGADHPENAQIYRQRVIELDPYAAQVTGSVFQSNEVQDAAVSVEHLDWNGQPSAPQADWSASQAIGLESGEQPDWLKNAYADTTPPTTPSPTRPFDQTQSGPAPVSAAASGEEEIPDFLRAAGWGQSTGAFDESKSIFGDEQASAMAAQPIEQGEMPDWVKAMAPTEATQTPAEEEELPDWINKIGTGALPVPSASQPDNDLDWMSQLGQTSEPVAPAQTTDNDLDWLSQLGQPVPLAPSAEPEPVAPTADEPLSWTQQAGEPATSESLSPADDLPDWLTPPSASVQPVPMERSFEEQLAQPASQEAASDDTLDWMKSLDQPAASSADLPDWMTQPDRPAESTQPASLEQATDERPDWMKPLDQPTASAADDLPDWMRGPEQAPESTPPAAVEQSADAEPDWLKPLDQPAASSADLPDWMTESERPAATAKSTDEQPDWMRPLDLPEDLPLTLERPSEEHAAFTPMSSEFDFLDPLKEEPQQEMPASVIPTTPKSMQDTGNLGVSDQERDDSFAWLENLAAKQGASEGLLTKPEDRLQEEPDWVKQAKGLNVDRPVVESSVSAEVEPDVPVPAEPTSFPFEAPVMQEPPVEIPSLMQQPTGSIEELGKSDQERDDSFAWLENLAAKQGASEGLLTKPEDRLEQEPEWVRQAKDLNVAAGESSVPSVQTPVEPSAMAPVEPVEEVVPPIFQELSPPPVVINREELGKSDQERDDSFAWLENLAAKQGASEGLLTKPEDRLEQEPEWVRQAKDKDLDAAIIESPASSVQTPAEPPAMEPTESIAEVTPPVFDEPSVPSVAVNREELGKSDQERDDSFAWLENLAAKQGASEGLLTQPEDRLEQEPEWVKQAKDFGPPPQEVPAQEHPALDDTTAWLRSLDEEDSKPAPVTESSKDDTAMWFKNLAEEESQAAPAAESSKDDASMWMQNLAEEESQTASAAESSKDDTAMWFKNLSESEAQPVAPAESANDETAMWLKSLDEAEKPVSQPDVSEQPDLPAWMQNLGEETIPAAESAAPEKEARDTSIWPDSLDEPAPRSSSQDAPKRETGSLPSWLRGLEKTESQAQESASAPQDDLPAWLRDETGEVVAEPTRIEPTRATDWQPAQTAETSQPESPAPEPASVPAWQAVEDKQPAGPQAVAPEPEPEPIPEVEPVAPVELAEEKPAFVEKPAPEPELTPATPPPPYKEPVTRKGTGMLTMPVDAILGSARNELSRSNIPAALDTYAKLIKKGRFLDEVVHDLREALYRYPVEVNIWQSLGDAYMRSNRLQDALDAYTKAEELLR